MEGEDLIAIDGTDQMDDDGNDIVSNGEGDDCPCACSTTDAPPFECSNRNTCNDWCNTHRASFYRGPDCPCPCLGRKDFPPCYRLTWTVSMQTGVMKDGSPGFDGSHYVTTEGPTNVTVEYNTCTGSPCNTYSFPVSQMTYHDDGSPGTLYHDDNGAGVAFGWSLGECGLKIQFIANFSYGVTFPGTDSGGLTMAMADSGPVDRCSGGVTSGVIVDDDCLLASVLRWEPICEDCAGTEHVPSEARAQACSDVIRARVQVWNGSEYIQVDFVNPTIIIRTIEVGDEKCCPPRDPTLSCDDCNSPQSTDCEECWELIAITDFGTISFYGRGDCPGSFTYHAGGDVDHPASVVELEFSNICPDDEETVGI